jgi:hypothetical protein
VIVKMIMEKQMECILAGETEVLGENLPQRHFCPSQNPTWPDPGLNPGRRGGKPATNRLSYGAAIVLLIVTVLNKTYIDVTKQLIAIHPIKGFVPSWNPKVHCYHKGSPFDSI